MNIRHRHLWQSPRFIVVLCIAFALLACDPAMIIRQSRSRADSSPLVVTVKEVHPFVGEKNYMPTISVTNTHDAPISIERVELRVNDRTYPERRPEDWPVNIAPRTTEQVSLLFNLGDTVGHVLYGKSAELRFLCVYNGERVESAVTLVGGNLR